jgi:hypothetical protein
MLRNFGHFHLAIADKVVPIDTDVLPLLLPLILLLQVYHHKYISPSLSPLFLL